MDGRDSNGGQSRPAPRWASRKINATEPRATGLAESLQILSQLRCVEPANAPVPHPITRQRTAAPNRNHASRQRQGEADQWVASNANSGASSDLSGNRTCGFANQRTPRSPSHAVRTFEGGPPKHGSPGPSWTVSSSRGSPASSTAGRIIAFSGTSPGRLRWQLARILRLCKRFRSQPEFRVDLLGNCQLANCRTLASVQFAGNERNRTFQNSEKCRPRPRWSLPSAGIPAPPIEAAAELAATASHGPTRKLHAACSR